MRKDLPAIPDDVFGLIADNIPISSVDVIILKDGGIILTKRTIPPHKGFWHLPGSIIKKNEKAVEAVKRCAKAELGVNVDVVRFLNYYELFTGIRHYISHLFIARYVSGRVKLDFQGSAVKIVKTSQIPKYTVPSHKLMISDAQKYLNSSKKAKSVSTKGYAGGPVR